MLEVGIEKLAYQRGAAAPGLKKAKDSVNRPPYTPTAIPAGSMQQQNLPWKRALAMEQELLAKGRKDSSVSLATRGLVNVLTRFNIRLQAFVIMNAYRVLISLLPCRLYAVLTRTSSRTLVPA
jgi:hypothetical protein